MELNLIRLVFDETGGRIYSGIHSFDPTPYNRKYNVLSPLLNKTFPSFIYSRTY